MKKNLYLKLLLLINITSIISGLAINEQEYFILNNLLKYISLFTAMLFIPVTKKYNKIEKIFFFFVIINSTMFIHYNNYDFLLKYIAILLISYIPVKLNIKIKKIYDTIIFSYFLFFIGYFIYIYLTNNYGSQVFKINSQIYVLNLLFNNPNLFSLHIGFLLILINSRYKNLITFYISNFIILLVFNLTKSYNIIVIMLILFLNYIFSKKHLKLIFIKFVFISSIILLILMLIYPSELKNITRGRSVYLIYSFENLNFMNILIGGNKEFSDNGYFNIIVANGLFYFVFIFICMIKNLKKLNKYEINFLLYFFTISNFEGISISFNLLVSTIFYVIVFNILSKFYDKS